MDLLPGLARQSSPHFNRYFYLLESLTIVQTPLLLCTRPSQSLLLAFVDSLLSLCQQPVNARVVYYITEILAALINELNTDEVTPQLADGLLKWLTAEKQVENPTAAQTVLRVLDRHKDKLERMVCKWLRDVITRPAKKGGSGGGNGAKKSKKGGKSRAEEVDEAEDDEEDDDPDRVESAITSHSDQLTVFKVIHIEVPAILPSLHSELSDLLLCDSWEHVRREFTGVYCEIFVARPSVIRHMPVLYETLLGRFKDVSALVRAVIAEQAGALMIAVYGGGQVSPVADDDTGMRDEGKADDGVTSGVVIDDLPHREQMSLDAFQDNLTTSVQDKDEKVRQHTVKSLAAACIHSPALVNLQLLTLMGKRASDRDHEVRKESLIGLSHVFHHHLTPYWRKALPPPPPNRKLRFIPSTLHTAVKLDTNNSLIVELAMDNHLIGLRENEVDGVDERTTCLLAIFDTLESERHTDVDPHVSVPLPSQRNEEAAKQLFLNRYITQKASIQKAVHDLIAMQRQVVSLQRSGEDTSSVQHTQRLRLLALAQRLFFEDDANQFTSAGPSPQAQRDEALRHLQEVLYGIFAHDDSDVSESLQALSDCRTPLKTDSRSADEAAIDHQAEGHQGADCEEGEGAEGTATCSARQSTGLFLQSGCAADRQRAVPVPARAVVAQIRSCRVGAAGSHGGRMATDAGGQCGRAVTDCCCRRTTSRRRQLLYTSCRSSTSPPPTSSTPCSTSSRRRSSSSPPSQPARRRSSTSSVLSRPCSLRTQRPSDASVQPTSTRST